MESKKTLMQEYLEIADLAGIDPDPYYRCEVEDCYNAAEGEWVMVDDEDALYTTMRCDLHPVKEYGYVERPL